MTLTSGRLSRKAFRSMPLRTMRLSKMWPFDLKSITAFFCNKIVQIFLTCEFFEITYDRTAEVKTDLEVGKHVGMISNEESVGHVGELLRVLLSDFHGRRLLVGYDVVHERSPTGSGVAEPHGLLDSRNHCESVLQKQNTFSTGWKRAHLNGSRAKGKQFISSSFGVSVHVDQNVDSILVNAISCFAITRYLQRKENKHFTNN